MKTKPKTPKDITKNLIRGNVSIDRLEQIFDPGHMGAMHVPGVLDSDFLKGLLADIKYLEEANKFQKARYHENETQTQFFYYFYIKTEPATIDYLPFIGHLWNTYTSQIYNPLAERIGFRGSEQLDFASSSENDIAINKYPEKGYISMHQDYPYNKNLIASFAIEGDATYSLAMSLNGPVRESYEIYPGSLTLMRAPLEVPTLLRKEDQLSPPWEPWHDLRGLSPNKYTIIFRHVNREEELEFSEEAHKRKKEAQSSI